VDHLVQVLPSARIIAVRVCRLGLLTLSVTTLVAGCATHGQPPQAAYHSVPSGGLALHARVLGRGSQVIVLLHGGPGLSLQEMMPLDGLLNPSRRLVAFDERGSGATGQPASGDWRLSAQVDDIESIRLSTHSDRIWLIGQSWGGLLAGAYVAAHPDRVAGLALIDAAPPDVAAFDSGQQAFQRRLVQLQDQGTVPETLPGPANGSCLPTLTAEFPAYVADAAHPPHEPAGVTCTAGTASDTYGAVIRPEVLRPLANALANYHGPALILAGAQDAFGASWPTAWKRLLPQATSVTIKQAGHEPVLEQPRVVLATLGRFLSP